MSNINWNNPNLALRQTTGFGATLVDHNGSNPKYPHRVFVEVARPAKWGSREAPHYLEVFNDDGVNGDGTIRLEQVIAKPDARAMRNVIDIRGWEAGHPIPLKTPDGKPGTYRRPNVMKAVSGRGERFQIVGTYPTKIAGIVPWNATMFWNDDGSPSGRGPAIDTKHKDIKWRQVES